MININFIPLSIEDWLEVRSKENYTFWVININDNSITGYFNGFDSLDDKEVDHFLTYRNYYYYKSINSQLELNEHYIKYEDDDVIEIDSIQNETTLKHMLNARKELIKKNKQLNLILKRSKIMNGINFG